MLICNIISDIVVTAAAAAVDDNDDDVVVTNIVTIMQHKNDIKTRFKCK